MTDPADDDRPAGSSLPAAGVARPVEAGAVAADPAPAGVAGPVAGDPVIEPAAPSVEPSADSRAGAHAQPIDVPAVAPRPPFVDRRRYFLSSLEPSGEFEAVIVAVTDGGRRRYFTTTDGARMTEVDHDWFDHRSSDGGRSLLELDERELGELEAELEFVRPVRGRDPVAEAEAEAELEAGAEVEADDMEEQIEMTDATENPAPAGPDVEADDLDPVEEELEAMVLESRRSTFVQADAAASAHHATSAHDAPPAHDTAPSGGPSTSPVRRLSGSGAIEQVALARGIAFIAHRGQLDRTGAPYIDHPGRIAERFDPATEPVEAAAAWLHDVLEDTAVTAEELFEAGILPAVIDVVRLLTRTPEVAADEYYARLRGHEVARRVKLADIDDNTARWRLRRLDYDTQVRLVEKYRVARRALDA